jgi:outer membrane protein assembly factor BamB
VDALTPHGLILVVSLLWCGVPPAAQPHWSQFRGPGASGIGVATERLPVEFGPERNVLWKLPVSAGHSSPCVWGDRVFLTGASAKELETLCVDRATGKLLWRRAEPLAAAERIHNVNSLASPTPTADGERVYAYFGSLGLLCYAFDGQEVWRRAFDPGRNTFGTAASPCLAGGLLVLNRDSNAASFLEAMTPQTGKTVWRVDRTGFVSGWSTPVVWRRGEVDELLIYGAFRLMAYDLADGSERWSVPGLADEPCITPVMGQGLVFVTSYNMRTNPEVIGLPKFDSLLQQHDADGNGRLSRAEAEANQSILSRADADGEGDHPLRMFFRSLDKDKDGELTAEEWQKLFAWLETFQHRNALMAIRPPATDDDQPAIVWQHPRGVPECPSPLYHGGRVYTMMNGGLMTCVEAPSGKVVYEGRTGARGPCYASPVLGDGKIYMASARGEVTVVRAGTEALDVLAHNDLGERIMATPALVGGTIYVRTENHLWAFGEK